MKVTRLRVQELRQFRAPFELGDIQPGLNIFTGANEAGKSTLVRAIRAAFFERHRSTSVDDLLPYGESGATPLVELDFDIGDERFRLTKSFLHKKRCELSVGTQRYEGVEAEDQLAERLGFQFALKGASRAEHWGIPGLLWIEQGSAQAVRDAVSHASDHLRSALDESLGEVAASGGDDVVSEVRRQRDELLTGTGKPRGPLQKAMADEAALADEVGRTRDAVARYRDDVDRLSQLQQAHAGDAQARPWDALRTRQRAAEKDLQAAQALAGERLREADKLKQTSGLLDLLRQQLADADDQQRALSTREKALAEATARHEQAVAVEAQCAKAEAAASLALKAAADTLAAARVEGNRTALTRQVVDATRRATDLAAQLSRANEEHDRAAALKRAAASLRIDPADLAALRTRQTRLGELAIRQAAVATRLRFELEPGAGVTLADEAITGQGERLLLAPTTLAIAGVGRLHVVPGGDDLAELAREQDRLGSEQASLLQRLGLDDVATAEARAQSHAERTAEASAADKAVKLLAPKGLDALRAELDAALALQAEAQAALARLPQAPADAPPTVEVAERTHDGCVSQMESARRSLRDAGQSVATATARCETARQERDRLKATLADAQRQADLAQKQRQLVETGAQEATLKTAIAAIDQRIAEARPEILAQDVERFRRSADEAEKLHQTRDRQIVQLEAELAAAGAGGLEETLAEREVQLAQVARRRQELQRRADALDFLLTRLESRRQALTRRLQAPLQKHLDRYLRLLFPSGRLEVDEALVPGALTRDGARGPEAADFDTLSFGAREQMGVISRLAYADLLQEAGRPTLVILDDALVHSDAQRLSQMKRVLFDAAQRHQVLLFTCHPEDWRDMGVTLRGLEGSR